MSDPVKTSKRLTSVSREQLTIMYNEIDSLQDQVHELTKELTKADIEYASLRNVMLRQNRRYEDRIESLESVIQHLESTSRDVNK